MAANPSEEEALLDALTMAAEAEDPKVLANALDEICRVYLDEMKEQIRHGS